MAKFGLEGNEVGRRRRRSPLAVHERDLKRENSAGSDDEVDAETRNILDDEISLFSRSMKRYKGSGTVDALPQRHEEEVGCQTRVLNRIETLRSTNYDTGMADMSFRMLGLNQWLCSNVNALGIKNPTAVQQGCIPPILQGQDVIGTAQTGTGKTAAYALPILQLLASDPFGIHCLCMTPTRELAIQIAAQFVAFSAGMTLRCQVIVGGEDIRIQASALITRPHIVVATPGRLMEHFMYDKTLVKSFSNLRCLVLDEADRLLDPGFEAELRIIMHNLPCRNRQTLLFSATITRSISALQQVTMTKALHFEAFEGLKVVAQCKQEYLFVPAKVKEV